VKLRELIRITHDDSNTWISGWWYTYPSEKYESQLGLFFPRYGKVENVPNHQSEYKFHKCPQLILMVSDIKTFFRTIEKQ
jgi:hypothetical protein